MVLRMMDCAKMDIEQKESIAQYPRKAKLITLH